jgi:hypothetical protein
MRRFLLSLIALIALAVPAHAQGRLRAANEPVQCPPILDIETNKYYLESSQVFVGRPGHLTEIAPEEGSWNLQDYRPNARSFYILCHYEDTLSTLTVVIPRDVHLCDIDGPDIICH